jgi:hypothetical protein
VCLGVGEKVKRRRTGGECLQVGQKEEDGGKWFHVHEKL